MHACNSADCSLFIAHSSSSLCCLLFWVHTDDPVPELVVFAKNIDFNKIRVTTQDKAACCWQDSIFYLCCSVDLCVSNREYWISGIALLRSKWIALFCVMSGLVDEHIKRTSLGKAFYCHLAYLSLEIVHLLFFCSTGKVAVLKLQRWFVLGWLKLIFDWTKFGWLFDCSLNQPHPTLEEWTV